MNAQAVAGYHARVFASANGTDFTEILILKSASLKVSNRVMALGNGSSNWSVKLIPDESTWTASAESLYVIEDVGQSTLEAAMTGRTRLKFRFIPKEGAGKPVREGWGYITAWEERYDKESLVLVNIEVEGEGAITFGTQ